MPFNAGQPKPQPATPAPSQSSFGAQPPPLPTAVRQAVQPQAPVQQPSTQRQSSSSFGAQPPPLPTAVRQAVQPQAQAPATAPNPAPARQAQTPTPAQPRASYFRGAAPTPGAPQQQASQARPWYQNQAAAPQQQQPTANDRQIPAWAQRQRQSQPSQRQETSQMYSGQPVAQGANANNGRNRSTGEDFAPPSDQPNVGLPPLGSEEYNRYDTGSRAENDRRRSQEQQQRSFIQPADSQENTILDQEVLPSSYIPGENNTDTMSQNSLRSVEPGLIPMNRFQSSWDRTVEDGLSDPEVRRSRGR